MTTLRSPPEPAPAPSHVEEVKTASDGLGGTLFGEVRDAALDHLSEDATHVLKFHGSYQQDDRDLRTQLKREQSL